MLDFLAGRLPAADSLLARKQQFRPARLLASTVGEAWFVSRLWVKNRYPKWNPGKWKHALKSAVPGDLILTHTQLVRQLVLRGPPLRPHTREWVGLLVSYGLASHWSLSQPSLDNPRDAFGRERG